MKTIIIGRLTLVVETWFYFLKSGLKKNLYLQRKWISTLQLQEYTVSGSVWITTYKKI